MTRKIEPYSQTHALQAMVNSAQNETFDLEKYLEVLELKIKFS